MNEHTPGPWFATRDDVYHRADGRQDWICHMNDADFRFSVLSEEESEEQQAANAHLIAAAPELLEACQYLCAEIRNGCDHKSEAFMRGVAQAEAIIAKAEGRE